ncbi:transposase [Pleionea sp. CnH1-48]|uniref:transposase n=1 Tax=Pleionea sp. CnH1-48 TaxID=2954494 RepID=UPI0020968965|nr:transposase [Pleionea sp. CnH1-48]MCO7222804.1 transposase [Pleionea sp. CnH1-48]
MPTARQHIVDFHNPGFYHCISRCVRRAYLCGQDPVTQQSFDHRKHWIEQRIHNLSSIFAADIYGYAVMSNHYHLVVHMDPQRPLQWSDEEVAQRWLLLYPGKEKHQELRFNMILADKVKLKTYRERLGNLSWLMAAINEPLARRSNKEDFCTGRFWEGRFKSQALLDEGAILACLAYVDLNPIRAGLTEKLEDSLHTSIRYRLQQIKMASRGSNPCLDQPLPPVFQSEKLPLLSTSLKDYLRLVEWTGQAITHPDKAVIPKDIIPLFDRLNIHPDRWIPQVGHSPSRFYRAIGSVKSLRRRAKQLSQYWMKGIRAASILFNA